MGTSKAIPPTAVFCSWSVVENPDLPICLVVPYIYELRFFLIKCILKMVLLLKPLGEVGVARMRARIVLAAILITTGIFAAVLFGDREDDKIKQLSWNVEIEEYDTKDDHNPSIRNKEKNTKEKNKEKLSSPNSDRALETNVFLQENQLTGNNLPLLAQTIGNLERSIEIDNLDYESNKKMAQKLIALQNIYYRLLSKTNPISTDNVAQATLEEYKNSASKLLEEPEGVSQDDRHEALAKLKRRLLNKN